MWAPTYELPFGHGRKFGASTNKVVDAALGGWTVSGITTYYSGRPFTPSIGNIRHRPSGLTQVRLTGLMLAQRILTQAPPATAQGSL